MCFKIAENNIESVKFQMSMSLIIILSKVFELDVNEINMELNLTTDLGLNEDKEIQLKEYIAEYFDGCNINISEDCTIQTIHDEVVLCQFKNRSA